MHGLSTMAYLNEEAVQKFRDQAAAAFDEDGENTATFTLEDIEEARQEGIEQGREEGHDSGYDAGSESGYECGFEEGHDQGRDEAEDEFSGVAPLIERLSAWGIDIYEPTTVFYDAALKALVWEQGPVCRVWFGSPTENS